MHPRLAVCLSRRPHTLAQEAVPVRWKPRAAALILLLLLTWMAGPLSRWSSPRRAALADYLMSSQDAAGALRNRPDDPAVTPYFANYAAMALLETARGPALARAQLNWYLSRLNERDRYGLSQTVYDYRPGSPGPPGYDSADAYAATLLSLARRYVERTGDWVWVRAHEAELASVAGLLLSLQDPDGLIRTGGPSVHRYLMDNAEDYRGLVDWAWLLRGLGQVPSATKVEDRANRLAEAIDRILWDPSLQAYLWVSPPWPPSPEEARKYRPDWTRWYADTVAQVYPALLGVPQPAGRDSAAYAHLARAFPRWTQGERPDAFPWLMAGLGALRSGYPAAAREVLRFAETSFPAGPAWSSPAWYSLEAASELRLRAALESPTWSTAWRILDGSY